MDKICIGLIRFLTVFLSCKAPKCQRKGEQIGKEALRRIGVYAEFLANAPQTVLHGIAMGEKSTGCFLQRMVVTIISI